MREPDISVIVPCFNAEAWIDIALSSVLCQENVSVELVVVDDGSTDGTKNILNKYDGRIVRLNKSNSGVSDSRRIGVHAAKGRYVKFLDADDVVPLGALDELLKVASRFPREAIIGRAYEIDVRGGVIGDKMYNLAARPIHLSELKKESLLTQATHSSLWLIPRVELNWDAFFEKGLSMGEEYKFCIEMIKSGILVRYSDLVVSHVRVHVAPTRLSRSKDESRHIAQAALIQKSVEFIKTDISGYSNQAMILIAHLCWSRGRSCLRIGCALAADKYFKLAIEVDPSLRPDGSWAYRSACHLLGPVNAEKVAESAKSLLRLLPRT